MTSLLSPTTATAPWVDVATTAGVKAQATGTILWDDVDDGGHVKGTITLQRRTYTTGVSAWGGIEFRLTFDGHDADDPGVGRLGAVVLPSKVGWNLAPQSKCKSQNTKARIVAATFPSNQVGLSKIRILIPFDGKGEKEKVMGEAMVSADLQCRVAIAANTPRTPKTPASKKRIIGSFLEHIENLEKTITKWICDVSLYLVPASDRVISEHPPYGNRTFINVFKLHNTYSKLILISYSSKKQQQKQQTQQQAIPP